VSERLAGRYELLEPIGSGGMGQVWSARDTVLERAVAVKMLPEDVAAEPTRRQRFEREARAVARLSHPNIMAIYDFGTEGGRPYAVMELLEGGDLRKLLSAGALPWRKALDLGLQVAHGLDAAHRQGVVHRDLKPTNLFLTSDGVVKLLDFGLARLAEPRPGERGLDPTLTDQGVAVGTAAYMAPEQVRGRPSDVRSDLFSLGCVMYEMLSGRRAFQGGSSGEVMSAILRDEPDPLAPAVPAALRDVIARCLRKRAEDRFGSAAEVCVALEAIRSSDGTEPIFDRGWDRAGSRPLHPPRSRVVAWAAAAGLAGLVIAYAVVAWRPPSPAAGPRADLEPNRVAVVPFANRTGDASVDTLAAITADRLTQGLSTLEELEVVPASVVAAAASGVGRARLAREVAAGTGAGLVLTGVWDAVGDGLELQATLEDARAGTVVRGFDPIPTSRDALQNGIATLRDWTLIAVQDHLHPVLAWGAGDRFPVYEAYLAHRSFWEEAGTTDQSTAAQHLFRAVALDPDYVRPRLQVGSMWIPGIVRDLNDMVIQFYQPVHEAELSPRQRRLVAMIDARLEGRWEDGFRIADEELASDPGNSWQRRMLIRAALWTNRPQRAVDEFAEMSFDPLIPNFARYTTTVDAITALHRLGRHEEELALARETLAAGSVRTIGSSSRSAELKALAALGRLEEIEAVVGEIMLEQDNMTADWGELLAAADELWAHGFSGEARALADRALEWLEPAGSALPDPECTECSRAFILMGARHFEEARALFSQLLAADPEDRDFALALGGCAAHLGDEATALEMARRLEQLGDVIGPSGVPRYHGQTFYGCARIRAALGHHEQAIRLLRQAVLAGYNDFDHMHICRDFETLRNDPEFREILRPKG